MTGAAWAQDQAASTVSLEEIVVTAQKRTESLQDVPTAISAISGEALARQNIANVQDLQTRIPTINMGEGFGMTKITMRGLGATSNFANEDPAVVLYVDGAVISRPEIQGLTFFDLERIEVLRGPQGTLYGRNATGGTINLITAKPTRELTGYARGSFGNYNSARAEFALSGPIAETLSARGALQLERRDGFGVNEVTGNDTDAKNTQAARVHLLWEPKEDVSLLLTGEYAHGDEAAGGHKFIREYFPTSTNPNLASPGRGGFPVGRRNIAADYDPVTERTTSSGTATFEMGLGSGFTFRNILNYREMERRVVQDYDASRVRSSPRTTIAVTRTSSEQVSEEAQLLYDGEIAGRPLSAIVGAFYFKEDLEASNVIGAAPANPPSDPPRINFAGKGKTEAAAIFWHLKYDVMDKLSIRLGGRYNDESRSIFNTSVVRGANGAGPPLPQDLSRINGSRSFEDYTNEAGVDFKPFDDAMFYYTYSEGFKSGAGLLAQTDSPIIEPETVTQHEVGLKSQLLDRRLMLNVSIFSAEIKGLQRQRSLPSAGATGLTTLFLNAAEMTSRGVEIDGALAVTERLRIGGSLAYLNAEFGSFATVNPLDALQRPVNVRGNSPDRAPEWKGSLQADYTAPLPNGGSLTFSGSVAYTSEQYFSEFNTPEFYEGAYSIYDASVTYTAPDERWTAQLWGKNLGDEFRHTEINANSVGRVLVGAFTPPRTWGVSIGYIF